MLRAVILALGFMAIAAAQELPLRSGASAGKELREALKLLETKQTIPAADKLRRLVEESGGELVSLDGKQYRPLVRVVQQTLQTLPPGEQTAIRDRSDPPAKKLLDEAKTTRQAAPARWLVDRYFLSSHTEEALLLLGELAFERGDFATAESYYQRLQPTAQPGEANLTSPKTPAATIEAGRLLAVHFQQDRARLTSGLDAFRKNHPEATGTLAGETGKLADLITKLTASPAFRLGSIASRGDWQTLGGDFSRNGHPSAKMPNLWRTRPTWQALFPAERGNTAPRQGGSKTVGLHPVTCDGTGFVSDGSRIFGFDLRTGETRHFYDLASEPDAPKRESRATLPLTVDGDFALTVADNRLFARLGLSEIVPLPNNNGRAMTASFLVQLGKTAAKGWEVNWKLAPPVADNVAAAWEGAPVVVDRKLYAVYIRETAYGLMSTMVCYPVSDTTPEKPLWSVDLADVRVSEKAEPRHRPEPLTWSGGHLVYGTQAGSIVAVDAERGRLAWANQYPSKKMANRDISPPVSQGGIVYIAPTDSDRFFAFEVSSGRKLWELEDVQIESVLGVVQDQVIVTMAGPQRGIRAYNTQTAKLTWAHHDDPQLQSWGRGLVSADVVLWPTKSGVFSLRPSDGFPLGMRMTGPHGNLAYADGVLIVGATTGVMGYVVEPDAKPNTTPFQAKLLEAEGHWRRGELPAAQAKWQAILTDGSSTKADRATSYQRLQQTGITVSCPDDLHDTPVLNERGWPRPLLIDIPPKRPVEPAPRPTFGFDANNLPRLAGESFDRQALPTLAAPLRDFETQRLATQLTAQDEAVFFVADANQVHAIEAGGPVKWSVNVPSGFRPTHAMSLGQTLFVGGPKGIMRIDRGQRTWSTVWPESAMPLGSVPYLGSVPEVTTGLSHFTLAPDHLLALWNETHLVAFYRSSGEIAWVASASPTDNALRPRLVAPSQPPVFAIDGDGVLVHFGPYSSAWFRLRDGQRRAVRSSPYAWSAPPVPISEQRLAVATAPGQVQAWETGLLSEPRMVWKWEAALPASLSGKMPQVRARPEGLIVAVSRNHGVEVQSLRLSGNAVRNLAMLWPVEQVRLQDADSDLAATYIPAEGQLYTIRHANGKSHWPTPIPLATEAKTSDRDSWHIHAGTTRIAAVGQAAIPLTDPAALSVVVKQVLLHPQRLVGGLIAAAEILTESRVPVLLLDPEAGQVRLQQDLRALGPTALSGTVGRYLVIVTLGQAYLLKS
ncbi:MAG: PQQ-binding-like beta-propeller repeat protein [Fimbriiglobus sp.]